MADIKTLKNVLIITTALGWWGIWFPELAVWGNAVCVSPQEGVVTEYQSRDVKTVWEICEELRCVDRSQIQIKSRLLTIIDQYFQRK